MTIDVCKAATLDMRLTDPRWEGEAGQAWRGLQDF